MLCFPCTVFLVYTIVVAVAFFSFYLVLINNDDICAKYSKKYIAKNINEKREHKYSQTSRDSRTLFF